MEAVSRDHETALVTGGAGFIGSNLVRHLLATTEYRVVVLDKLTYAGHLETLADLEGEPRFRFVRGDIGDRRLVDAVLSQQRPRVIVNLAAETHVDRSIDDAEAFLETNLMGTFVLLERARRRWDALPERERAAFRFVQVSTDEVYGSIPPEARASEATPFAPSSPYAASKAAADQLVMAWHRTYGLPALGTHCSNNFGPFQFPEKLIPLMILNALEGLPLPVYGDGENVRDWLFVEDHCDALVRVIEQGRPGERYNVGSGVERSNRELVARLCTLLEEERPARDNAALQAQGVSGYSELMTFVEDRPGHDRRYAIDDAKLRRELAWKPRHAFDEAIRLTVRWYLANLGWCAAVGHDRRRLGRAVAESSR